MHRFERIPAWGYALITVAIVAIGVGAEWYMGRMPLCACGYVEFWHGLVNSAGNSQHIADWYSFSHVIHGILFYAFFRLASGKRLPIALCFIAAVALEVSWEVFENSSFIIDRYRDQTAALGYVGDSLVNSAADMGFMMLGFALAMSLPVWASVALVLAMELGTLYMIRDNLLLNVMMLAHPIAAIKAWQISGGVLWLYPAQRRRYPPRID